MEEKGHELEVGHLGRAVTRSIALNKAFSTMNNSNHHTILEHLPQARQHSRRLAQSRKEEKACGLNLYVCVSMFVCVRERERD